MSKLDFLIKTRDMIWDKKIDYERDYPECTATIILLNVELNIIERYIFECIHHNMEDNDD